MVTKTCLPFIQKKAKKVSVSSSGTSSAGNSSDSSKSNDTELLVSDDSANSSEPESDGKVMSLIIRAYLLVCFYCSDIFLVPFTMASLKVQLASSHNSSRGSGMVTCGTTISYQ